MSLIGDYFSFSKSEKRGTVVLLIIILALIGIRPIIWATNRSSETDFSEFEKEIIAFENAHSTTNQAFKPHQLFNFDPNTTTKKEWEKLGFKEWQINAIMKYKKKGGSWKIKSDVSKIYGVSAEKYEELKPYIQLPEAKSTFNKPKAEYKAPAKTYSLFDFNPNKISSEDWKTLGFEDWQIKSIEKYKLKGGKWKFKQDVSKIYGLKPSHFEKLYPHILLPEKTEVESTKNEIIDINIATSQDFTKLKGIHSTKYGDIIIEYREKLGGFVNKNQLLEVWNMTTETYQSLEAEIILGDLNTKKLNVNTASIDELKSHPYIKYKVANAIVKFRLAHNGFKDKTELLNIHLIDQELYNKLSPYIKIE